MSYITKSFVKGEVLTHEHMNNIISGIDELKQSALSNPVSLDTVLKITELPIQKNVDLFVFAGQSNMMGAAHLPPIDNPITYYAYEYKYQNVLKGAERGEFVYAQNPAGDWHYNNIELAYGEQYLDVETGKSKLSNYSTNTHFVPACRDQETGFGGQSEFKHYPSATMAPYFARYYAQLGNPCIYAHMAKGSTKILNYFTQDSLEEYNKLIEIFNQENGTTYKQITDITKDGDAFDAKYFKMLEDYAEIEPDKIIKNKCFIWLQGESDTHQYGEYRCKLQALWKHLQSIGFTHFFIVRVGWWGSSAIINEIKAQIDFCEENDNCYIITRAASLIPHPTANLSNWWIKEPSEEYKDCRDSYIANTSNHHFNEKAHKIFAKVSAENINRILHLNLEPILEEENIKGLENYGGCKFTIIPTPSNAIVKINGEIKNSINVKPGTSVNYEVSLDDYITQTGQEIINTSKTLEIVLDEYVDPNTTIYRGSEDFNQTGIKFLLNNGTWTVQNGGATSKSTDFIEIDSNTKVWLQFVWRYWSAMQLSCVGLYDENKTLVSALTYEDFKIDLEGATGGTAAFDTPLLTNAVMVSDIETRDNVKIKYVVFTAWQASEGGLENTSAKIIKSN